MATAVISRPQASRVGRPRSRSVRQGPGAQARRGVTMRRVAPARPVVACDDARVAMGPASGAARRPGVHLTRRGRALLVLVFAAILLGMFSLGRVSLYAADSAEPRPTLEHTVVQPGDTLWSIAQRVAPESDPRQIVDQLRRLNHLKSSAVSVGQDLVLPRAAS